MKTKLIAILLSCISLQVQGHTGTEGHGGDPLRLLFEDARPFAADRVMKAIPCAFGSNVSIDVRNWILNHKQSLADDISQSEHVWLTDKQSTCAFTQTNSRADITLSFETCRPGIRDISDAVKILVHESVHHFAIADEYFADKVADAVYNLGNQSACTIPPSQDPFDPASCPGTQISTADLMQMIPLPTKIEQELGRFKVSARRRVCYSANWCAPWNATADQVSLHHSFMNNEILPREGVVSAIYSNNKPSVSFLSDSWVDINSQKIFWSTSASVNNYSLETDWSWGGTSDHNITGEHADVKVVNKSLTGNLQGWMTRSCLRQVITDEYKTKDDRGNDVTVDYEVVFLSHFGK